MSSPSLRGRRLTATLIDLALFGAAALFIMLATGIVESADAWVMPQPIVRLVSLMVFTYLLLNGFYLIQHAQTIGKRWLSLTIVHADSGNQLGPWRLLLRAYGVLLVALVLGGLVQPLAFVVVVVLGFLPILGRSQRCLHDYLASSVVVGGGSTRNLQ